MKSSKEKEGGLLQKKKMGLTVAFSVIVCGQSAGKSAVLNSLIGYPVLVCTYMT